MPRRRRRRVSKIIVTAVAVLSVMILGLFTFGWWQFNRIDKVDIGAVLSPAGGAGTNFLIVGTDSREGISKSDPNAEAFLGGGFTGDGPSRTDTIMLLRIEGGKKMLLSIPRDLWVRDPKTNQMGRINAVYQSGRAELVKAVKSLGLPVHHYLEINFVSFARLVDAVGGIDVEFPNPARDEHSGLYIDKAGVHRLDGVQALAYVRSRYYQELQNGRWVNVGNADLGRVERQRAFLSALMGKIGGTKNPIQLVSIGNALASGGGLKLDDELTYLDALGLAWQFRSFKPESETIPTTPATRGGAAVLDVAPNAEPVLSRYR